MRILLVEDYGPLRLTVANRLKDAGYTVDETADGDEGLWYIRENDYALAILDIMLPNRDGLELVREVRKRGKNMSVLMITARDSIEDRVKGLDAGADDYLVKPFELEEMMARVRALVRRTHGQRDPVVRVGGVELDTRARSAKCSGAVLELTDKEFSLLELLMLNAGQVVKRGTIWEQLYEFGEPSDSNVVDVFVARLRKKLEAAGGSRMIQTRRGQGFIIETEHQPG